MLPPYLISWRHHLIKSESTQVPDISQKVSALSGKPSGETKNKPKKFQDGRHVGCHAVTI